MIGKLMLDSKFEFEFEKKYTRDRSKEIEGRSPQWSRTRKDILIFIVTKFAVMIFFYRVYIQEL